MGKKNTLSVWWLCGLALCGLYACSKGPAGAEPTEALGSQVEQTPPSQPTEPLPEPPKPEEQAQAPAQATPVENAAAAAVDPNCGGEDNPCPLEKWMEENTADAAEKEDLKRLAILLDQIAELADAYPLPKEWNEGKDSWTKISLDAAKAARAGDLKGARKSCKGCHKPWRKAFQKSPLRIQPLPAGWPKT